MNLGSLIVKLLLERSQFRAELAQTVQETNAAASDIKGQAQALAGAVSDAMGAQTTAVQTTVRALGVLGPVLGTVAAAAAVVGVAHHQAAQETLAYEKAIILSGNAAGVTSGQLADMARRIDGVAGTQANAAAALATMTASGKVAAENLEKVSLAAIEMERATGQAVGDTERIFARLGDAPTKAALSLNESMHFLTASTYAQIKAAEDLGDKEGAAAIAQGAAADAMRTRAAEIAQHLGSLERVMRGVRSVAAEMWDAVLDIGRPATLDSQIAALNNKIKQTAWRGPAATEGLQQEIAYLQEQQRMVKRSTEAQAENDRVQQARIELSQALEQTASKQEKMALAVARANALADRSGATAAQRLQLVTAAQEKFAEKSTSATKATASEYDKLMQRLGVDVPKAAAQAQAAQQGYNKAQAEFVALAGSPAWAKFTNEQRASAAAMFEQKIASEQAAEAARSAAEEKVKAQELLAKADLEAAQAREKYIASLATGLDKIQAEIAAQEEATARMGLSKEAIADLDAAKLDMMATDLELQAIKAMDRNLDEQTYDALKQQAQAYRDLAKAKQAGAAKEVAVDEAKKAADEWQRTSDQVNQSLTDALMRGFESGKDFAQNLRDTVVNMFKTMVLRPVVSAIVSPVAGALTGALGLSTAAQAGQGGGLSTALSGASLLSSFGSLNAGLSYGAQSLFANGLGTTLTAGTQMLGAGSYMGGLGTIAGALGPIALGIGLLSSLIKKSTPHMGAGVTYSAADGLVRGADQYSQANYGFGAAGEYNSAAESTVGAVARGIATALDSTARTFGRQAGFEISTAFADDKSKDGAWGQLAIRRNGETILDWRDTQTSRWAPREFSDGEAGLQEYQTAVAQSMREALDKMDLPGWAGDMLDALGDSPSIENLGATLDQINAAQVALEQMGKNLVGFADYTNAAIDALVKAAGGVDGLVNSASTYYDNFYSEAEKAANVTRDITAALADVGLQMPATRQEFRALVEAQMALGESGTKAVAALLGVAGAFASVTAAVQSEQAAERADRLAAQRAREKQAAEALQKQIEAYADSAEQFNTLRDSLLKAGDAAGLLAAVTERAFADPSGKYMNGKYELPRWGEGTTAAAYNYRYGEMQARMRQQLGDEASANALRIENVAGVLQAYSVEQMMSEYDPVTGAVKLAIQQAIVDASGDLGFAVRDAVSGAALYAAMADVRARFTSAGPGLASIAAARASAADAGRSSFDRDTGLYRIGGMSVEYGKALDNLKGAMSSGAITADVFERSVMALNEAMPGAAESVGTLEDLVAAVQGASYALGNTGLNSIRHYFGSLSELTAEFAKAAAQAQEPIAQTTAAIGRLNSAQYAFAESAAATLQGFGGAGAAGGDMLSLAGVKQDISRAQLIAEAAGIASAAMTTADAAAAAAQLAQSPAFAELGAKGIRDAALLLDGVGQYNAEGFERAFIRISDALAKGNVTDAQYKALFDVALDMFEGVPEETRTLIDSMTRLRDAMSGFADGLLIDEQRTTLTAGATLAEMQRQYAQAFAGASTGDNEAIGKYQQLANTLLDKELYGSQAEYSAAFGRVYGDARQLESIGINTLAHAQGNEMVAELKDMNAKLNKRVEDLEKNLMAALAQIAKNTSDTSRGIEQQIVMAEDTP